MNLDLETTILLITIVLTGLTAGLCFTWSNAVTPGIGQLDDLGFLHSFQAMNRSIINPTFILVFFGPVFGHIAMVFLKRQSADQFLWFFLVAAVLFIVGVVLVTIFKNVPLNEILDQTNLETTFVEDLKVLRQKFETPWNQWHMVRTICSLASFALLLIGLVLSNTSS